MSFQDNRLFDRATAFQTLPRTLAPIPRKSGTPSTAPRFLVARDKAFANWWGSFATLFTPARLRLYSTPVRLFRNTPLTKFRFAGRPLVLSVLVHIAAFLWYPYLPSWSFSKLARVEAATEEPEKIYYRVNLADFVQKLPRVTFAGTGGRPGSGLSAEKPPVLGRTVAHPKITIILTPPRADNRHQTIHQSQSAPDLRITMDLKLPNIISGAAAPLRPKVFFNPSSSKPVQTRKTTTTVSAPELTRSANPSVIPLSELAKSQPSLPVQPAAPAATNQGAEAVVVAEGALLNGKDPNARIVVGVDPSLASSSLTLPPGNRWAELSISPAGGGAGSPGGVHGGAPNAGRGGTGTGGDGSGGLGQGDSGGGGGLSPNAAGVLTVTGGGAGSKGSSAAPDPMLPANMVYAVPSFVRPRKGALVVSAGPMGGGGLDAYGAMHCGKIYSVFLQMPGKSWTLQFCESKHESTADPSRTPSAVIRLESGLTPPDAEVKFDFRRVQLPPESAHKVILLKGLIREDGTVENVQVFRGLQPQMDEAARLAFFRWKFKPAMREGHPVAVQILVGIPSDAPPSGQSPLIPAHLQSAQ